MAVELEIKFTGMFTFVPSSDGKQLVVLLPRTGVLNPGNRVHQHHANLVVEREHAPPNPRHPKHHPNCAPESAQRGVDSADKDPCDVDHTGHAQGSQGEKEKMKWEYIPFGGYRLVFTGLAAGPEVTPPPAAVDLTPYAGKLDAKQIGPTPDDSVWAQVVLPGATVKLSANDKVDWKIGDDIQPMSHQVIWKTEVSGEARVEFRPLGGGRAVSLPLKPKDGGTSISLEIEHLPHQLDRHKGAKCCDAPHFVAYYDLFGNPREEPVPVLVVDPPVRLDDKHTCMTSQAKIG